MNGDSWNKVGELGRERERKREFVKRMRERERKEKRIGGQGIEGE